MKKRILITGVTGFLGSNLAKTLLAEDHDIVALKRKSSSLQRLASVAPKIKYFDIEDLDFDNLFRICGKIDTIIHTATCYGRNNESVSDIFSANTELPLKLLDAGSRAGVKVFINTDTILNKYLNLYSLSKNQFLQWGKYFTLHQHISFVNLRLEHFYGAGEDPNKFSAYVINSCLNNVPQLELTKGEQKRDFMYIDDVVSAYVLIIEKFDTFTNSFTEFDVGSGQSVSIREFVETVHQLTASKANLAFGALPYREGEVMNSVPDISGLQALGWHCQYDIKTGLKKVIEEERELAKVASLSKQNI